MLLVCYSRSFMWVLSCSKFLAFGRIEIFLFYFKFNSFYLFPNRSSKGGHSKKKGPRTPSPPPPVPLDIPVVGKKHKNKHKNKEKSEEKQKDGKDRGRDTEKHKEKKEKRRYLEHISNVLCAETKILFSSFYQIMNLFWDCRDRSDSSNKAKRAVTSDEHSGSVSPPSRTNSPLPRKKSSSPKASHKAPALPSPPNRWAQQAKKGKETVIPRNQNKMGLRKFILSILFFCCFL